jgi:VCBS repeat-containing protein
MRPQTITRQLDAADADGIATSQTPGGAGDLTLDGAFVTGGVAFLDVQRHVLITPAGADAARTFTITGTDESGNTISEDVAGANNPATSESVLDFFTVTQVAVDAATAAAIEIGTSAIGASIPVPLDYIQNPFSVGLGLEITGTVDVTVQFTFDDIREGDGTGPFSWLDHPDLTNATANADAAYVAPVIATRLLTNSGTGTAINRVVQAGHTSS